MRLTIKSDDLLEARRLRERGMRLDQCCPLSVALRRMGWRSPVMTRRYVLLGRAVWEPSDGTKRRENAWAESGRARPYFACLRPRAIGRTGGRERPAWQATTDRIDHLAADRRAIHRTLEHYANWPE